MKRNQASTMKAVIRNRFYPCAKVAACGTGYKVVEGSGRGFIVPQEYPAQSDHDGAWMQAFHFLTSPMSATNTTTHDEERG